ncbi:MAG: ATP-binding protein [Bacteroidales bacterium]
MRIPNLKFNYKLIILSLFICLFGFNSFAINSNKVLIISSYGPDYQWSNSIIDGINFKLKETAPGIELNVEYLSSEIFSNPKNWKLKISTLLNIYGPNPPLAVILISDEAWLAYNSVNTQEFKDVPIVLSAVKPHTINLDYYCENINTLQLSNFAKTEDVIKNYNATGVLREMNISGYISLVKNALPNMDKLALITDNRFYGIYTKLIFEEEIKNNYANFPIEYYDARFITTDSLLTQLPNITPNTGLLLTSWLTGKHGFEYSKDYIYKEMSERLKTPIFITNNIGLEKDYFLGGYFNNAEFWGEETGLMLLAIINGKSPREIPPIIKKDEQCYINWHTLRKFDLSPDNFPDNTIYKNRPESLFEKYRIQISFIILIFIILVIAYILTLQSHLRLRKAQKRALQAIAETNAVNEQLMEARKNLIIALNKAEESDRLKSAFLANMSHEIRTPLNSIVGFSGLIATATTDEERIESAAIIKRNSDMLLQLISDILDISKIEAGTLNFFYEETGLNAICNDTVTSLRTKCAEGVTLSFIAPDKDIIIYTDQNRLMQVLVNLINNAIKFTKHGSIEVGYFPCDNQLIEFYVKDTGIGIPEDQADKIFGRFFKLNTYVEGTGLGLPICKTIVGILGGDIGVESELNKGSRFWFRINRKCAPKA